MLGDGCLSLVYGRNKFISITGNKLDDLPFFEKIIGPLLFKFRGKSTKIKFRKSCNAIEFNFVDKELFNIIHSFGFPIGKKGQDIIIPKIFYEKNLLKYIVQGFFATDGSFVLTKNPNKFYPRLEAHTVSRNLLLQIYEYLIALGMLGHFYTCKRKVRDLRWKTTQPRYRFQFNGMKNLILFNDLIGFVNPKQKKRFVHFLIILNNIIMP